MAEKRVTITSDDVLFVEQARQHYKVFAEAVRDDERTAGIFRKQEFYAERFLLRIGELADDG